MAGSEVEERLRAKAVAKLRVLYPTARIIHELPLEQFGVRIDLAAVTTDSIAVVEIKSERDVLHRLGRQISAAVQVADHVIVCAALKHETALSQARAYWNGRDPGEVFGDNDKGWRRLLVRHGDFLIDRYPNDPLLSQSHQPTSTPQPEPGRRWKLLWAEEMRRALANHFGGDGLPVPKGMHAMSRSKMRQVAQEHMTGREIRLAVCKALRGRAFPRADDPC